MFWQYGKQKAWLKPWKITIVADDHCGLSVGEVQHLLNHCPFYRLLLVEFALDFDFLSGVTKRFIQRHGLFGKSRHARSHSQQLRYGSRKSDKVVRCYKKKELGIFRVELEIHSRLLRNHEISQLTDLSGLAAMIYPEHVQFVAFDWSRLKG